jgi:Na+/melibiose symporter-like transporter
LSADPTSKSSLLAYAGPAIPLRILLMQLVVYVPPFYAAEMGLEIATIGLIFFLARGWDALIDPLVGNLSDRTRSRWGRRKPWMAVGTPLLIVSLWAFCQPAEGVGFGYLAVTAFLFYVAMTAVDIPYMSWGPELSRDYSQRTRIIGYREAGGMLGTVLATALPLFFLAGTNPSLREILQVFVVAITIVLPITVVIALWRTPQGAFIDSGRVTLRQALAGVRGNAPFLRLAAGVFAFWLAGGVFNALVLFMVEHSLELPNSSFLWFVFAQYTAGIAMLPLAVRLGNRIGKHRALIFGALVFMGLAPVFMVIETANFQQALLVFIAMGAVTSFIWVMPPALVADAVEYGMLRGGADDPAIYMSVYYFMQKMAMAAGVGLALPLAGAMGFNPAVEVTEAGLRGLNFICLILPFLLALPGAALLLHYPIDQRRHLVIRRWLARRTDSTML